MAALEQRLEIRTPQPKRHTWTWPLCWAGSVVAMGGLEAYNWLVYTARPDIPQPLGFLDFLFCIGVATSVIFLGLLIGLRVLRPMRIAAALGRIERLALATGLGLGALSLTTLVLGMLHLYYAATFGVVLAIGPWIFPAERRWVAALLTDLPATFRRFIRVGSHVDEAIARYILAALALSALLLAYIRDLTLPGFVGYDTYQYHWAVPMLLLRVHSWQGFPGWAHANLPYTTEMLNLIALSLRAPTAANIIQDTFDLLFALLVFALLRRYFGSVVAWLAVVALATVPLLIVYASQSYVEAALMFYGFAAITLLILWLERGAPTGRVGIEALLVAGAALGLAIGAKYTAFEYVPGLLALLAVGFVHILRRASRTPPTSTGAAIPAIGVAPRGGWRFVALGGIAFALGAGITFAPWLVKDWIYLGNPVYPALSSIFGAPAWNSTRDQMLEATFHNFGPHAGSIARFHLFALNLFYNPKLYGEGTTFPTGPVALAALLILPAGALALWRGWLIHSNKRQGKVLILAALTIVDLLGLLVWNQSGALVERYALPMVVLTTIIGATLIGWLAMEILMLAHASGVRRNLRPAQVLSWALLVVVIAVCASQEHTYLYANMRIARDPLPLITGAISQNQYSVTYDGGHMPPDFMSMVNYVNTQVPHNERLLMLGRGSGYFFTNRDYVADSGGDWIPYIVSAGKTPSGMLDVLHSLGFEYVAYDTELIHFLIRGYGNYVLAAALPTYVAFQEHDLIPIGVWGYYSLYRVPAALPAQARAAPRS